VSQLVRVGSQVGKLLSELAHQVGEPVGNGVALVLRRVSPLLGVLQQGDQQERDDRCGRLMISC